MVTEGNVCPLATKKDKNQWKLLREEGLGQRSKGWGQIYDIICNPWSQRVSFNAGRSIDRCLSTFNNTKANKKRDSTIDWSDLEEERAGGGNKSLVTLLRVQLRETDKSALEPRVPSRPLEEAHGGPMLFCNSSKLLFSPLEHRQLLTKDEIAYILAEGKP